MLQIFFIFYISFLLFLPIGLIGLFSKTSLSNFIRNYTHMVKIDFQPIKTATILGIAHPNRPTLIYAERFF